MESVQSLADGFDEVRDSLLWDYDNARLKAMEDFAAFARKPWRQLDAPICLPKPISTPQPPVLYEGDDSSACQKFVDEVCIIDCDDSCKIPAPMNTILQNVQIETYDFAFAFFGTTLQVRIPMDLGWNAEPIPEGKVAEAIEALGNSRFDLTLSDCLCIKDSLCLCDWAYLNMLDLLSKGITDSDDLSTLLFTVLYMQSGYTVRLATDGIRLYALVASHHTIYDRPSYKIDDDLYYCIDSTPGKIRVCDWRQPGETSFSLKIERPQRFSYRPSSSRIRSSKNYPDMNITVSVNLNLLDFFDTYPASETDGDWLTRWAMYANTPMDYGISEKLYSDFRSKLSELSEIETLNILLDFVQTGFDYEYDKEVWGHERAFFPEETLYYNFSDCEDRAILFSRLVRDILGLECILIYYPGHMATAVALKTDVDGDYVLYNNKKYTIADPTYINAPIGKSMPGFDEQSIHAIILK